MSGRIEQAVSDSYVQGMDLGQNRSAMTPVTHCHRQTSLTSELHTGSAENVLKLTSVSSEALLFLSYQIWNCKVRVYLDDDKYISYKFLTGSIGAYHRGVSCLKQVGRCRLPESECRPKLESPVSESLSAEMSISEGRQGGQNRHFE